MAETFHNDLTDTVDALRENVAGKEKLIDSLTRENVDLKVEVGRLRGLIKAVNYIIKKATGHKGV